MEITSTKEIKLTSEDVKDAIRNYLLYKDIVGTAKIEYCIDEWVQPDTIVALATITN